MIRFGRGIGVVGILLCAVVIGCTSRASKVETAVFHPSARTETLGEPPHEHYHRVYQSVDQDRRALSEDLDVLFMTDRPTRLSRWHGK